MSPKITPVTDSLNEYISENWLRENEILRQLRLETSKLEMARMQISPEQGQFMAMLVKLLNVEYIVEIGTFTGYSALAMAQAMSDDGQMFCCDVSEEWTSIAKKYWALLGVQAKISLKLAPALQTLDQLLVDYTGKIDLVFIDADKANYEHYYEKSLKLLKPGGVVLLDNVFWGGAVIDQNDHEIDTVAIRSLNKKIHDDQRVEIAIVPVGDGLTLARKK